MKEKQEQLIHELSKQYTFETFDFKTKSAEDLVLYYQEISIKISKVIDSQNSDLAQQGIDMLTKLGY